MKDNYRLIGGLEVAGKTYAIEDTTGILTLAELELEHNFYGGRANAIAKTKTKGLYMVLQQLKPIDILIDIKEYKEPKNEEVEKGNESSEKGNDKKENKKSEK